MIKLIFYFLFLTFNLLGCATIKEAAKGVAGISTKEIEEARPEAIKKIFNYDYKNCYDKIIETLEKINAYIYVKDEKKNILAIYVSSADTTSVGIFLQAIDANNTEVEVSSESTYAKELISARLFKDLEKGVEDAIR